MLEIGAGNGILTAELARQAPRVFAVESDPVWVARLRERFAGSAFERGKLARLQKGTRQPSPRLSRFGANTQVVCLALGEQT